MKVFIRCLAVCLVAIGFGGNAHASVVLLADDFDPGIDAGTFFSTGNATALGNGINGFLSGNALHFDGAGTRFATTTGVDITAGGVISFDFRGGNEGVDGTTYWEDSEGNVEWVDLAYSVDGGGVFVNFLELSTEADRGENPTIWNSYQVTVPTIALSSNTMFRFQQRSHNGDTWDHWAIDNLSIVLVPEPTTGIGMAAVLTVAFWQRRRRSLSARG